MKISLVIAVLIAVTIVGLPSDATETTNGDIYNQPSLTLVDGQRMDTLVHYRQKRQFNLGSLFGGLLKSLGGLFGLGGSPSLGGKVDKTVGEPGKFTVTKMSRVKCGNTCNTSGVCQDYKTAKCDNRSSGGRFCVCTNDGYEADAEKEIQKQIDSGN